MIGARPAAIPSPTDRVAAERVATLYRNAPIGVVGALFGVAVLAWVLIYTDRGTTGRVRVWLAFTIAVAIWQLALCLWRRFSRTADARWRLWALAFGVTSFVEGCRWGLGEIWLATPGSVDDQLWVLLVATSAAASSVSSLGGFTPAFYALLIPASVPFAIWSAWQGGAVHWAMTLLDIVFATAVALLGLEQGRSLSRALRLRFENLDLAEDLKFQKDRAETANAAKTRFLAAASHDLRQPLHALAMFVAALSGRRLDAGARALTAQIAGSMEAMNSLFDALLDVSQLDAGVIGSRASMFAVQPLLERICRDHAAEAKTRGVALIVHPCRLSVRTDPALLEQILRNFVANAVRYTPAGRIVVGCRRGARLTIGVWDTGPGIATEDQESVFEEFFQVGNPERDRTKGLGLGLAISRRVADLIDCPIALRSTPGKGSAFTIAVPLAPKLGEPESTAPDGVSVSAGRGPIAVVDDDAAIRLAMVSLLSGWGHEVMAAGCWAELKERLAGRAPALLICDWRLRGGETAMSVIDALRASLGEDVPALLITGETAPERLREAHETGLVLLHKPVAGGKLRAAIGNLIRAAPVR